MKFPADRHGKKAWVWFAVVVAGVAGGCAHGREVETAPATREPPAVVEAQPAPAASPSPLPSPSPLMAAQTSREAPPPAVAPRTACEARLGQGGLRRAAVNRTLDAGLGHWLRGVDVDPKLERGRFRGWIVRNLPEDACYAGLDLQAGDIVTRINGRRVERPEEAKDIWDGLRTSPALVIDFLRDGRPRTLRFDILDR